jgi:FdrA protein
VSGTPRRHLELRPGTYRDSVTLMQLSRVLADERGVISALVAMATPLNLDLLAGLGFSPPEGATPNDLVLAVAAADDDALRRARDRLDIELARAAAPVAHGFGDAPPPRTVGAAVRRAVGAAPLVLVSTPGRYAFVEAADALDAGASVLMFSDNVPVREEIWLKDEAARRGLLMMGPDCGTAVVGGVGLGFANVVRPGPVGLVAASGTGAQQVMCLLDIASVGISHCLGVGGRDLSASVAGRSTLAALDALDADPTSELIVVVSKPPAPDVATAVRAHAGTLATPVVFALMGPGQPDLTAAVESVLDRLGAPRPASWPAWRSPAVDAPPRTGYLRGLFSGGTLRDEAMTIASAALGPTAKVDSGPNATQPGHYLIDFGDDSLTQGRPHPMIDSATRLRALADQAVDPSCAVVLVDVVLGHGAHPDPAAELAPAIAAAREVAAGDRRDLAVVVSLCGSGGDPQGLDRQAGTLCAAGATVFLSNAAAARHAVGLLR